jgi:hypothetical protein
VTIDGSDFCVCDNDDFAHDGDDGDHLGFAVVDEAIEEGDPIAIGPRPSKPIRSPTHNCERSNAIQGNVALPARRGAYAGGAVAEHAPTGAAARLMDRLLAVEFGRIEAGRPIPFGGSCLCVASKI